MIDLHCHTLHSDGTDTPEDLARLGERAGLTALCLTDHDTLGGIPAFLAMQPLVKVRLLAGTELSCQFMGHSLHVLGLLVDPADATSVTTTTVNSSSPGTITANSNVFYLGINQRASYRWVAAPGGELVSPATSSAGFQIRTRSGGYTGTATATIHFQEQ